VRRLKRAKRGLRVGILVPIQDGDDGAPFDAGPISADFVVASIADAVIAGLADKKAVPLKAVPPRLSRKRARPKAPLAAKA
jgi:hypothetical protein